MALKLNGSSSGFVALDAPASAGSNTLILPTSNGSAGQVLKNSSTAGTLEFGPAGSILQVQSVVVAQTTQIASGGTISELDTDLRIDFTPKAADSNLILEFFACFYYPNSTNIQFALFWDNTAAAGVQIPPGSDSRRRVHWANRNGPEDDNDADALNMKIVTSAVNTNLRQYTIHHGSEGASAQFCSSTLSSAGGANMPMVFIITEVAA